MTDESHDHEETANDRWIGAMMHVQRLITMYSQNLIR